MDKGLLNLFRNKVNDRGIILHIYKNKNGKNRWSVICSAMDWIEVALDGIELDILSHENNNEASIKMITFISCVDLLNKAVIQLNRVFKDTKDVLMRDDNSVFNQNVTDNNYFATIRACFAAHPIDLRKVYPDIAGDERWYASWSGGTFSKKDFAVVLYSNNRAREPRIFDVSFGEIYTFAEKRYHYLKDLIDIIDNIVNDYFNIYRNIPISINFEDTLQATEILINENQKRLEDEYYNWELQKIKKVFTIPFKKTKKNSHAINVYKEALQQELIEIKEKLQKMEQTELESTPDDSVINKIAYPFSKLSDAVWQNDQCLMFDYVVEEIKEAFSEEVDIEKSMTQEEVYVLACAGSYLQNNN